MGWSSDFVAARTAAGAEKREDLAYKKPRVDDSPVENE